MATITELEPIADVDLSGLPQDARYEVIRGRAVEKSSVGSYPVGIASILQIHLGAFVDQARLGRSVVEMLFRIDARTQYRPDVAFVSHERWPVDLRAPKKHPWNIVPDVAIEVISETDRAEDVLGQGLRLFPGGLAGCLVDLSEPRSHSLLRIIHADPRPDAGRCPRGRQSHPRFPAPARHAFRGRTARRGRRRPR